jgi:hypothetical protein
MQEQDKYITISYYSEVIDNWGRVEASSKGAYIYNALMNVDEWTDDMIFEDPAGNKYFIDDLAGKTIRVPGIGIVTIPNDNN